LTSRASLGGLPLPKRVSGRFELLSLVMIVPTITMVRLVQVSSDS
jgi:hypothetical protein